MDSSEKNSGLVLFEATAEPHDTPPNPADSGQAETIETKQISPSWESGIAQVEERDRKIRALVIALDEFFEAGMLEEARRLVRQLREAVDARASTLQDS